MLDIQNEVSLFADAVTRAAIVMIPTMFREKIGSIFKEPKESEESVREPLRPGLALPVKSWGLITSETSKVMRFSKKTLHFGLLGMIH